MIAKTTKIISYDSSERKESDFDSWERIFNEEIKPTVFVTTGKINCSVVLYSEETTDMKKAIKDVVPWPDPKKGPGLNNNMACSTCRNLLSYLVRFRTFDNKPYFLPNDKKNYPESLWPLWEAARTGTTSTIKIVSRKDFCTNKSGGFVHFSIGASNNVPELSDKKVKELQRLVDKYFPMMIRIFELHGVNGIHTSLDTLIKVLPDVTYGIKLMESAKWFRKHITENFKSLTYADKVKIIINAMMDLNYDIEIDNSNPVLPLYHQLTGNTLNALEMCNNVQQLKMLLKTRLSPLNYQVKTTSANDGNIDNAIKHIGKFGTRIMTLEEAIKYGAIPINHGSSSLSAFSSMRPKKSGAAGFASRCSSSVKNITTMNELMKNLPDNLEVYTTDYYSRRVTPVYAVSFTEQNLYEKGVYQTPFSWGFNNGSSPTIFGISGYKKVIAIFPMKNNYLFICENAIPNKKEMGPCCHVSLLTAGYNRSCGQAFGNLNKHMTVEIPEYGPYAIGVGVSLDSKSLDDPNPPIVGTVRLRSNGVEFTIS